MKQRTLMITLVSVLVAGAGCKLSTSGLLGGGGGDTTTSSNNTNNNNGGGGGGGGGGEQPAPVHVPKSNLCEYDDNLSSEENEDRRDRADKTTICDDLAVVEPADGAERVAARAPGWCENFKKADLVHARPDWAPDRVEGLSTGYWWDGTPEILGALCASPQDPAVQQQTAYFYQWWVNLTGLAPAQLDGLFKYFGSFPGNDLDLYERSMEQVCKAFPRASEEASARDQELAMATRDALGCGDSSPYWVSGGSPQDISWHLDAAAEPPSELVRTYFVLGCLGNPDTIEDRDLAAYAVCGTDGRALDAAKLDKETEKLHELGRAHARMQLGFAKKIVARYEAVAQAKVAQDPAWQTLIYDAPARGWAEWTAMYRASKPQIDAARAYEKVYFGPSRKAAKGCWAEAWGNLEAHVAAKQTSTLIDAKQAMTDVAGAIMLEHLTACADGEGEPMMHSYFGQLFEQARPARGPRYAAFYAVLDALNEIKEDRAKFPAELQWFSMMFGGRSPLARGGGGSIAELDLAREDRGGVVKGTSKKDGGVLVEFKTERWKEGKYACTTTNRILMFERDGTPIYERDCVYQGQQWVESTHDPIWVPAALAGKISAGTFVRSATSIDRHGDAWNAIPIEVWANKEREKLVAYLGIAL